MVLVAVQLLVPGSYLPPVSSAIQQKGSSLSPPQTIIWLVVLAHTAV